MLAYYDGTRSLIPVKVLSATKAPRGGWLFRLESTADRYGYPKGTRFDGTSLHTFPRPCLRKLRGGSYRIMPYDWSDYYPDA